MSIPHGELLRTLRANTSNPEPLARYSVATASVLAATGIRLAPDPVLGTQAPYLPFALAVMVAARFGGLQPGFFATLLSALSVSWFFLAPRNLFALGNSNAIWGLALFVALGESYKGSIHLLRHRGNQAPTLHRPRGSALWIGGIPL